MANNIACPPGYVLDARLGLCVVPCQQGYTYFQGECVQACPANTTLNDQKVCIRPTFSRAMFVNESLAQNATIVLGGQAQEQGGVIFGAYSTTSKDIEFADPIQTKGAVTNIQKFQNDNTKFYVFQDQRALDSDAGVTNYPTPVQILQFDNIGTTLENTKPPELLGVEGTSSITDMERVAYIPTANTFVVTTNSEPTTVYFANTSTTGDDTTVVAPVGNLAYNAALDSETDEVLYVAGGTTAYFSLFPIVQTTTNASTNVGTINEDNQAIDLTANFGAFMTDIKTRNIDPAFGSVSSGFVGCGTAANFSAGYTSELTTVAPPNNVQFQALQTPFATQRIFRIDTPIGNNYVNQSADFTAYVAVRSTTDDAPAGGPLLAYIYETRTYEEFVGPTGQWISGPVMPSATVARDVSIGSPSDSYTGTALDPGTIISANGTSDYYFATGTPNDCILEPALKTEMQQFGPLGVGVSSAYHDPVTNFMAIATKDLSDITTTGSIQTLYVTFSTEELNTITTAPSLPQGQSLYNLNTAPGTSKISIEDRNTGPTGPSPNKYKPVTVLCPTGATRCHVVMWGAGGSGEIFDGEGTPPGPGGAGGFVECDLDISSISQLELGVGLQGNAGGTGGIFATMQNTSYPRFQGGYIQPTANGRIGQGGGATWIRDALSSTAPFLVVAGGGGGSLGTGIGGAGGGANQNAAGSPQTSNPNGSNGLGGQSAQGSGANPVANGGYSPQKGSQGQTSAQGGGGGGFIQSPFFASGGAGYSGGGASSSNNAGAGGGSSFVVPVLTQNVFYDAGILGVPAQVNRKDYPVYRPGGGSYVSTNGNTSTFVLPTEGFMSLQFFTQPVGGTGATGGTGSSGSTYTRQLFVSKTANWFGGFIDETSPSPYTFDSFTSDSNGSFWQCMFKYPEQPTLNQFPQNEIVAMALSDSNVSQPVFLVAANTNAPSWDATTTYTLNNNNNTVRYAGVLYASLINLNTNNQPDVSLAEWTEISGVQFFFTTLASTNAQSTTGFFAQNNQPPVMTAALDNNGNQISMNYVLSIRPYPHRANPTFVVMGSGFKILEFNVQGSANGQSFNVYNGYVPMNIANEPSENVLECIDGGYQGTLQSFSIAARPVAANVGLVVGTDFSPNFDTTEIANPLYPSVQVNNTTANMVNQYYSQNVYLASTPLSAPVNITVAVGGLLREQNAGQNDYEYNILWETVPSQSESTPYLSVFTAASGSGNGGTIAEYAGPVAVPFASLDPGISFMSPANLLVSYDNGNSFRLAFDSRVGTPALPDALTPYMTTFFNSVIPGSSPPALGTANFTGITFVNDAEANDGYFVAVGQYIWDTNSLVVPNTYLSSASPPNVIWVSNKIDSTIDIVNNPVTFSPKVIQPSAQNGILDPFFCTSVSPGTNGTFFVTTGMGVYTANINSLGGGSTSVTLTITANNGLFSAACTTQPVNGQCKSCPAGTFLKSLEVYQKPSGSPSSSGPPTQVEQPLSTCIEAVDEQAADDFADSIAGAGTPVPFLPTGQIQTYVVPSTVSQVIVNAFGAGGGNPGQNNALNFMSGGAGAAVTGIINVDDILTIKNTTFATTRTLYVIVGTVGGATRETGLGGLGSDSGNNPGGGFSGVFVEDNSSPPNYIPIVIAGGGGGGGAGPPNTNALPTPSTLEATGGGGAGTSGGGDANSVQGFQTATGGSVQNSQDWSLPPASKGQAGGGGGGGGKQNGQGGRGALSFGGLGGGGGSSYFLQSVVSSAQVYPGNTPAVYGSSAESGGLGTAYYTGSPIPYGQTNQPGYLVLVPVGTVNPFQVDQGTSTTIVGKSDWKSTMVNYFPYPSPDGLNVVIDPGFQSSTIMSVTGNQYLNLWQTLAPNDPMYAFFVASNNAQFMVPKNRSTNLSIFSPVTNKTTFDDIVELSWFDSTLSPTTSVKAFGPSVPALLGADPVYPTNTIFSDTVGADGPTGPSETNTMPQVFGDTNLYTMRTINWGTATNVTVTNYLRGQHGSSTPAQLNPTYYPDTAIISQWYSYGSVYKADDGTEYLFHGPGILKATDILPNVNTLGAPLSGPVTQVSGLLPTPFQHDATNGIFNFATPPTPQNPDPIFVANFNVPSSQQTIGTSLQAMVQKNFYRPRNWAFISTSTTEDVPSSQIANPTGMTLFTGQPGPTGTTSEFLTPDPNYVWANTTYTYGSTAATGGTGPTGAFGSETKDPFQNVVLGLGRYTFYTYTDLPFGTAGSANRTQWPNWPGFSPSGPTATYVYSLNTVEYPYPACHYFQNSIDSRDIINLYITSLSNANSNSIQSLLHIFLDTDPNSGLPVDIDVSQFDPMKHFVFSDPMQGNQLYKNIVNDFVSSTQTSTQSGSSVTTVTPVFSSTIWNLRDLNAALSLYGGSITQIGDPTFLQNFGDNTKRLTYSDTLVVGIVPDVSGFLDTMAGIDPPTDVPNVNVNTIKTYKWFVLAILFPNVTAGTTLQSGGFTGSNGEVYNLNLNTQLWDQTTASFWSMNYGPEQNTALNGPLTIQVETLVDGTPQLGVINNGESFADVSNYADTSSLNLTRYFKDRFRQYAQFYGAQQTGWETQVPLFNPHFTQFQPGLSVLGSPVSFLQPSRTGYVDMDTTFGAFMNPEYFSRPENRGVLSHTTGFNVLDWNFQSLVQQTDGWGGAATAEPFATARNTLMGYPYTSATVAQNLLPTAYAYNGSPSDVASSPPDTLNGIRFLTGDTNSLVVYVMSSRMYWRPAVPPTTTPGSLPASSYWNSSLSQFSTQAALVNQYLNTQPSGIYEPIKAPASISVDLAQSDSMFDMTLSGANTMTLQIFTELDKNVRTVPVAYMRVEPATTSVQPPEFYLVLSNPQLVDPTAGYIWVFATQPSLTDNTNFYSGLQTYQIFTTRGNLQAPTLTGPPIATSGQALPPTGGPVNGGAGYEPPPGGPYPGNTFGFLGHSYGYGPNGVGPATAGVDPSFWDGPSVYQTYARTISSLNDNASSVINSTFVNTTFYNADYDAADVSAPDYLPPRVLTVTPPYSPTLTWDISKINTVWSMYRPILDPNESSPGFIWASCIGFTSDNYDGTSAVTFNTTDPDPVNANKVVDVLNSFLWRETGISLRARFNDNLAFAASFETPEDGTFQFNYGQFDAYAYSNVQQNLVSNLTPSVVSYQSFGAAEQFQVSYDMWFDTVTEGNLVYLRLNMRIGNLSYVNYAYTPEDGGGRVLNVSYPTEGMSNLQHEFGIDFKYVDPLTRRLLGISRASKLAFRLPVPYEYVNGDFSAIGQATGNQLVQIQFPDPMNFSGNAMNVYLAAVNTVTNTNQGDPTRPAVPVLTKNDLGILGSPTGGRAFNVSVYQSQSEIPTEAIPLSGVTYQSFGGTAMNPTPLNVDPVYNWSVIKDEFQNYQETNVQGYMNAIRSAQPTSNISPTGYITICPQNVPVIYPVGAQQPVLTITDTTVPNFNALTVPSSYYGGSLSLERMSFVYWPWSNDLAMTYYMDGGVQKSIPLNNFSQTSLPTGPQNLTNATFVVVTVSQSADSTNASSIVQVPGTTNGVLTTSAQDVRVVDLTNGNVFTATQSNAFLNGPTFSPKSAFNGIRFLRSDASGLNALNGHYFVFTSEGIYTTAYAQNTTEMINNLDFSQLFFVPLFSTNGISAFRNSLSTTNATCISLATVDELTGTKDVLFVCLANGPLNSPAAPFTFVSIWFNNGVLTYSTFVVPLAVTDATVVNNNLVLAFSGSSSAIQVSNSAQFVWTTTRKNSFIPTDPSVVISTLTRVPLPGFSYTNPSQNNIQAILFDMQQEVYNQMINSLPVLEVVSGTFANVQDSRIPYRSSTWATVFDVTFTLGQLAPGGPLDNEDGVYIIYAINEPGVINPGPLGPTGGSLFAGAVFDTVSRGLLNMPNPNKNGYNLIEDWTGSNTRGQLEALEYGESELTDNYPNFFRAMYLSVTFPSGNANSQTSNATYTNTFKEINRGSATLFSNMVVNSMPEVDAQVHISDLAYSAETNVLVVIPRGSYGSTPLQVAEVINPNQPLTFIDNFLAPSYSTSGFVIWNKYESRFLSVGYGSFEGQEDTTAPVYGLIVASMNTSPPVAPATALTNSKWTSVGWTNAGSPKTFLSTQILKESSNFIPGALGVSPTCEVIAGSSDNVTSLWYRIYGSDQWQQAAFQQPGVITALKFVGFGWYIATWDASIVLPDSNIFGLSSLWFASSNMTAVAYVDAWSSADKSFKINSIDFAMSGLGGECPQGFEPATDNPDVCYKMCPPAYQAYGSVCAMACPPTFATNSLPSVCIPQRYTPNRTNPVRKNARNQLQADVQTTNFNANVGPPSNTSSALKWAVAVPLTAGLAAAVGLALRR